MTTPEPVREAIGPGEAARMLGVNARTMARWDKEGIFKADFRTPGGTRRYYRDRIEKMLKRSGS